MDLDILRTYLMHPANGLNEDIVQEALLIYSQQPEGSIEHPKGWTLKVARNLMNMERRRLRRVARRDQAALEVEASIVQATDVRDPLRHTEARQELTRCLENWKGKRRPTEIPLSPSRSFLWGLKKRREAKNIGLKAKNLGSGVKGFPE